MKDFLKRNWLVISGMLLVTMLYVLAKFLPESSLEQWWLSNIAQVLGIMLIPLPGLKKSDE